MAARKIKIGFIVLLVALGLFTTAGIKKWLNNNNVPEPTEDATVVFRKLYAGFADAGKDLNIAGTVTLMDDNTIKEKTSFQLVRQNHRMYHRFDVIQQISDDNVAVQLDTLNKYIVVSRPDKEWIKNQKKGILPFEAMLNDTASFKIRFKKTGAEHALEIENDFQPEIKSCVLVYDPGTYTILRTVIQWWKQPGVADNKQYWETIITYEYNGNEQVDIKEKLDAVIKVKKGKVDINPAYADCEVEIAANFNK